MKTKNVDEKMKNEKKIAEIIEKIPTRGRTFKGFIVKKFDKRVVVEFERMVYIPKYERYKKSKTRLHARLPEEMKEDIQIGDYVLIRECRPLSKIIHFIVVKKIRKAYGEWKK